MMYGTSHFVSREAAVSYYRPYGEDAPAVDRKIAAGEIHIGPPTLASGEFTRLIDGGRRFAIVDPMSAHKPSKGDPITYGGRVVGNVQRVDGNLCWTDYGNGEVLPFIWRFTDGVNALHDWPNKAGARVSFCPEVKS